MREMMQKARAVEMTQERSTQERALNNSRARARSPEDKGHLQALKCAALESCFELAPRRGILLLQRLSLRAAVLQVHLVHIFVGPVA
jgi:hypothetical protein